MDIEEVKKKGMVIGAIGIILVIVIIALNPFVIIGPGERGIVTNWGEVQEKVLKQGLHFMIPVMQKVIHYSVREDTYTITADSTSENQQKVEIVVALTFRIVEDKVNVVYNTIGPIEKVQKNIIKPKIQQVVKSISAKYNAEELIIKRESVKEAMKKELSEELGKSNIFVKNFAIINFRFSKSYQQAIEAKQVAEQKVKEEQLRYEQIKIVQKQKVAKAQAAAEAFRLEKKELTPQLIRLRAIQKWDGHLPQVTGGAVPFIDLKKYKNKN